jgi:hypothetical protein
MTIERNPFTSTRLEEERVQDKSVVISLRLNKKEIRDIEDAGRLLQQEMQSSIVKQLMMLGLLSLQNEQTRAALRMTSENTRRNIQRGITEAEPKIL